VYFRHVGFVSPRFCCHVKGKAEIWRPIVLDGNNKLATEPVRVSKTVCLELRQDDAWSIRVKLHRCGGTFGKRARFSLKTASAFAKIHLGVVPDSWRSRPAELLKKLSGRVLTMAQWRHVLKPFVTTKTRYLQPVACWTRLVKAYIFPKWVYHRIRTAKSVASALVHAAAFASTPRAERTRIYPAVPRFGGHRRACRVFRALEAERCRAINRKRGLHLAKAKRTMRLAVKGVYRQYEVIRLVMRQRVKNTFRTVYVMNETMATAFASACVPGTLANRMWKPTFKKTTCYDVVGRDVTGSKGTQKRSLPLEPWVSYHRFPTVAVYKRHRPDVFPQAQVTLRRRKHKRCHPKRRPAEPTFLEQQMHYLDVGLGVVEDAVTWFRKLW